MLKVAYDLKKTWNALGPIHYMFTWVLEQPHTYLCIADLVRMYMCEIACNTNLQSLPDSYNLVSDVLKVRKVELILLAPLCHSIPGVLRKL